MTRNMEHEATPGGAETTLAVLSSTSDGRFAGAIMPMSIPLDTRSQWQHLLDGLLGEVVRADPEEHLDGLYAFTWWSDESSPADTGLLLTRITDNGYEVDPATIPTLQGLLGLMLLTSEPGTNARTAVLGLRGYTSQVGKMRPDRVFAAIIDTAGRTHPELLDRRLRRSLNLLGRTLIALADKNHPGEMTAEATK